MSNRENRTESKRNPWLMVAACIAGITSGLRICARHVDDGGRDEALRSAQEMNSLIDSLNEQQPQQQLGDGPIVVEQFVETDLPIADMARSAGIPQLGPEQSADIARQLYEQKCDAGEAEFCNSAARILHTGQAGEVDEKKARALYRKGCELGHGLSCNNLGVAYLNRGNGKRDNKRALRLFKRSCTPVETVGCYNLGYLYERGIGVKADAEKAAKLIARACDAGDKDACAHDKS